MIFTLSLTFIVCITWINIFQKDNRLSINKEYEITYTHFIKMGLNNNTNGGYWHNDVEDSFSKATKMERQEENLNEIKLRVRNYGLLGLLKHQIKKTLTIYNDGTFGWGLEGRFYYKIKESDFKMADHVRNFYYGDGEYYHIFKYITQGTWLLILFLLIGNIFERNLTNKIRVIYLALIGLFLFESIFEARSRYLYIYIPILFLKIEQAPTPTKLPVLTSIPTTIIGGFSLSFCNDSNKFGTFSYFTCTSDSISSSSRIFLISSL